jgi:hypothetical protein
MAEGEHDISTQGCPGRGHPVRGADKKTSSLHPALDMDRFSAEVWKIDFRIW